MIYNKEIASKVAYYLLEIKAIKLNPQDLLLGLVESNPQFIATIE